MAGVPIVPREFSLEQDVCCIGILAFCRALDTGVAHGSVAVTLQVDVSVTYDSAKDIHLRPCTYFGLSLHAFQTAKCRLILPKGQHVTDLVGR